MEKTRVCKACNQEKLAIKGVWVTTRGIPEGRLCLACNTINNNIKRARPEERAKHSAASLASYYKRVATEDGRKKHNAGNIKARLTALGRQRAREATLKWFKENPDKANAKGAKRRAAKLKQMPAWADLAKIREFYSLARKLTQDTGVRHSVDHIIPLRGKLVSGLHVEANLQVITFSKNSSKSNKFEDDLC